MRTFKLFATTASAGDNTANCLITRSGRIKSVRWEASLDQVADNSLAVAELSIRPTNQAATNDTVGDISVLRAHQNLVTSGLALGHINKQEMLDFPIAQNERIYLHLVTLTTTTISVTVYIDVAE